MQNLWLSSSNPAALSQMDDLLPGILNANYLTEDGSYKRIQQGNKLNHYSFNTFSYSKIKDINLYGGFNYDKSFEKGLDYSDVNDPFRLTPFQLIDTLGNDTYNREFFSATGGISKPFGENLILGMSCDFNVGLSAQDKDPRPQNKVFKMTVSPGLIYSIGKFKLGFNMLYKYYNEEIEITIIEKNAHATFFTVHGPGLATYHEASSFNRLYKRNSGGFDVQFAFDASKIKTLSGLRLIFHEETAGDGRKASNASWAYIKKDSKLKGLQFDLYNNTGIYDDENIQYFGYELNINTMLGIEIIQRLEQVDSTVLDDWITYKEEEKYYATDVKLNVFYEYLKLKNNQQRNFAIKAFGYYHSFSQNYYIPNQEENYQNLLFGVAFDKSFDIKKNTLTIGLGLKYKFNLDGVQNFSDYTFIAEKILSPDFEFLTSNYYAPGLEVAFEIPMKKIFNQYFIKSTVDIYKGDKDHSRTILNFSTGVTF